MNTPTSHARFRADLKAFADGELSPLARFRLAHHLRGCEPCREELHHMKTLSNDLRESQDAPELPLSDELRAHILDQMPEPNSAANEEFERRRRRVTRKKAVLALGVCSLAGALLWVSLPSAVHENARLSETFSADAAAPLTANESGASSAEAQNPVSAGSAVFKNSRRSDDRLPSSFADGHVRPLANSAQTRTARGALSDSLATDSAASAASSTFESVVPPSRAVHREGSLTVAVENAETASDNTSAIIQNVGGFVAQASLGTGAGQKRTATLDCRVPVDKFELVVQKIGQLGTVRAKSLNGQDITAQVASSGARRQALSQELSIAQARLRQIENAKKPDQYQIAGSRADVRAVRLQAAQARAQLETLQKYGSLSSLYVSLQDGVPVAKTAGWTDSLSPTTRAAWDSFLSNARLPLQLLMWVLAYSPLWLPALLIWRKYGRKWLEA